MPPHDDSLLSANHKIIIPILLSLFVLLGLVATILIIRKKSRYFGILWGFKFNRNIFILELSSQNRILASSQSETPSIANIMSKSNVQPNYPAVRVQNNNLSFSSVDSNKYKMEGNGRKSVANKLPPRFISSFGF